MIEAVGRDGYIVAQEVLPEAEDGDVRLFLMNGNPWPREAITRRSGESTPPPTVARTCESAVNLNVKVDDNMLQVAEAVRPKLLADGMFLVGLDIVGDKLMEVNVFSPGGGHLRSPLQDQVHRRRDRRARAQGRSARPISGHVVESEPRDPIDDLDLNTAARSITKGHQVASNSGLGPAPSTIEPPTRGPPRVHRRCYGTARSRRRSCGGAPWRKPIAFFSAVSSIDHGGRSPRWDPIHC